MCARGIMYEFICMCMLCEFVRCELINGNSLRCIIILFRLVDPDKVFNSKFVYNYGVGDFARRATAAAQRITNFRQTFVFFLFILFLCVARDVCVHVYLLLLYVICGINIKYFVLFIILTENCFFRLLAREVCFTNVGH